MNTLIKIRYMLKIFRHKYKALSGYEVANEIIKLMKTTYSPLTKEQEQALKRELGDSGMLGNLDMPFQAYKWEKEHPNGRNTLWRLSVIFFLMALILTLPIVFIYWCINGKAQLPIEWKLTKMLIKWEQNVFK